MCIVGCLFIQMTHNPNVESSELYFFIHSSTNQDFLTRLDSIFWYLIHYIGLCEFRSIFCILENDSLCCQHSNWSLWVAFDLSYILVGFSINVFNQPFVFSLLCTITQTTLVEKYWKWYTYKEGILYGKLY